jgi:hypothetical protein
MDPLVSMVAKRAAAWWLRNRPLSPEKRAARKERRAIRKENRQRKKEGLPPLEVPEVPQRVQGKLTYSGILLTGLSYVLDTLQLVPEGYDAATVAGVLVGLVAATYGRFRREKREV